MASLSDGNSYDRNGSLPYDIHVQLNYHVLHVAYLSIVLWLSINNGWVGRELGRGVAQKRIYRMRVSRQGEGV